MLGHQWQMKRGTVPFHMLMIHMAESLGPEKCIHLFLDRKNIKRQQIKHTKQEFFAYNCSILMHCMKLLRTEKWKRTKVYEKIRDDHFPSVVWNMRRKNTKFSFLFKPVYSVEKEHKKLSERK